jgi:hypothetical protein
LPDLYTRLGYKGITSRAVLQVASEFPEEDMHDRAFRDKVGSRRGDRRSLEM